MRLFPDHALFQKRRIYSWTSFLWLALCLWFGQPHLAFADPSEQMAVAIQECLTLSAAKEGHAGPVSPNDLPSCIGEIDLDCRLNWSWPEKNRYSCWELELEAWTAQRQTMFDRLLNVVSKVEAEGANTSLAEVLINIDQIWQKDRYADCDFLSMRWLKGTQRIQESFTCPIYREAWRAILYLQWAQWQETM